MFHRLFVVHVVVFLFLTLLLGGEISCSGCSEEPVCVNGYNPTTVNLDKRRCSDDCECNNQLYEGYCGASGECVVLERISCLSDRRWRKRVCDVPKQFQGFARCVRGAQICQEKGLEQKFWGNCKCGTPSEPASPELSQDGKVGPDSGDESVLDSSDTESTQELQTEPIHSKEVEPSNEVSAEAIPDTSPDATSEEIPESVPEAIQETTRIPEPERCSSSIVGESRACFSGPSGSLDVGSCKGGTQECLTSGLWSVCRGEVAPSQETCNNNKDENCNAVLNDGCSWWHTKINSEQATLSPLGKSWINDVAVDGSGNVYVTGYFQYKISLGTFSLTAKGGQGGGYDVFVAKIRNNGTVQWVVSAYEAKHVVSGKRLAVDSQGTVVYVVGNYRYNDGFATSEAVFGTQSLKKQNPGVKQIDMFIAKLDAKTGSFQWVKSIGNTNSSSAQNTVEGYQVAVDSQKLPYVVGSVKAKVGSSISVCSTLYQKTDATFLAKLDASGSCLWSVSMPPVYNFGDDSYGSKLRMLFDTSNNLFVAATIASGKITATNGSLSHNTKGEASLLFKLDASGNLAWNAYFDSLPKGGDRMGLAMGKQGELYLTGSCPTSLPNYKVQTFSGPSPVSKTMSSSLSAGTGSNVFVARFDPQKLQFDWGLCSKTIKPATGSVSTYKNSGYDVVYNMKKDMVHVIATADGIEMDGKSAPHRGMYDIVLLSLSTQGKVAMIESAGGTEDDYAVGLVVDSAGNRIVVANPKSYQFTFGKLSVPFTFGANTKNVGHEGAIWKVP